MMEPSRQILWNIGNRTFLDIATFAAVASLLAGFTVRIGIWLRGNNGVPAGNRRSRLFVALRTIFNQKGMIRGRIYLVMHRCVFYGMLILFAGSVMVALEMHFGLHFLRGTTYLAFTLILDIAGLAVLLGIVLAAYKRYVVRPERLESRASDALLLAMLALVTLSGFLVKGQRLFATSDPWAAWSPVGNAVALLLGTTIPRENATGIHAALWYGHAALAFSLIALLPWTKLLHLLAIPLNHYLSLPWAERASLAAAPAGFAHATGTVADCTRKQLVEADACIECGRCKKLCSMQHGGMPSAPVTMMKNMKKLIHGARFTSPLVGSVIDEPSLWSCSACRSCEDRCPMNGAHAARIVDIRRGRIGGGSMPEAVATHFKENEAALADVEDRRVLPDGNSDVYVWPGCREDKPGQTATLKTLLELLGRAGLNATVLEPPACCGGPVRRLGNESLFRRDASANIDYLKAIQGKTIITPCPHCFNTLKNEYPQLGGNFRVMHHAQFLAGLLAQGKVRAAENPPLKAAFHDPCFLGRYNGEFAAPRALISAAKELTLVEMKHSRMKSFCCGSGGGTVIAAIALSNSRKLVRQAVKEGAEAVITCCPYCHENLVAAAQEESPDTPPRILDVLEIFEPGFSMRARDAAEAYSE
jgi:Fe-S oxidoreductase/nitrate reductase gamma subunit